MLLGILNASIMKALTIILIVITLALGGYLFYQHTENGKLQKANTTLKQEKDTLTTSLDETRRNLDDAKIVADKLGKDLTQTRKDLADTSNYVTKVSADLAQEKKNAAAAAEAAKVEIAKREQRISELEGKQSDLTKQMGELTSNIENLGKQIAETEKKLAASEGDREFLLKELKRLQTEKAELERQFNDLSVLRTQVAKLKDELSIARKLEWIRMGIYGSQEKKATEILMTGMTDGKPNYNLNVELKEDGSAKLVPSTNNPPKAPAPK
jgi:chromosome segregation ATPase